MYFRLKVFGIHIGRDQSQWPRSLYRKSRKSQTAQKSNKRDRHSSKITGRTCCFHKHTAQQLGIPSPNLRKHINSSTAIVLKYQSVIWVEDEVAYLPVMWSRLCIRFENQEKKVLEGPNVGTRLASTEVPFFLRPAGRAPHSIPDPRRLSPRLSNGGIHEFFFGLSCSIASGQRLA